MYSSDLPLFFVSWDAAALRFPQASAHSGATGGDAIVGFAVVFFVAMVDGCPAD